jgi:hypothetical protein
MLVLVAALAGCGAEDGLEEDGELIDVEVAGKADAFNSHTNPIELIKSVNNNPTLKADDLVPASDLDKDISVATELRPFSGDYWPMSKNGILQRWQGASEPSPAEKYGGLFLTPAQQKSMYDWIQDHHGTDVPEVASWFGICQGWTASAIMEKAPQKAITVRKYVRDGRTYLQRCTTSSTGCQTFTPGDLTALLAESYAAADARFIGDRCDTSPVDFKRDKYGRITQSYCRSNPGTLFLAATSFIKKAGRAFAVNAVNNNEVWNQPAYQYRITRYEKKTAKDAAVLVSGEPTKITYDWNPQAVGFRRVTMTLTWSVESPPTVNTPPPVVSHENSYDFIVELDATGNVIGGEWLGKSKTDHPPFFWSPIAAGAEIPNFYPSYVKALLTVSNRQEPR